MSDTGFTANDILFMRTAILFGSQSKCVSKQVGCVITKNGSIISTGINGTPSGMINCHEVFDSDFDREEHHAWSNVHELHAEVNAIAKAHSNGISIKDSTVYCTLQPCFSCMKMLITFGIGKLVYYEKYDKADESSIELAKECGIIVRHFNLKL